MEPSSKIHMVPNGVAYREQWLSRTVGQERYGIAPRSTILAVGRMIAQRHGSSGGSGAHGTWIFPSAKFIAQVKVRKRTD